MKISSTFIQKRNMKTNCRTFCKMGPTDLTYGRSWFAHIIIFTIIRSCNLYHPQLKCAYQSCSFIIVCVWDVTALYKLLVEAGIIYLSIAIICMQRNLPRIFFLKACTTQLVRKLPGGLSSHITVKYLLIHWESFNKVQCCGRIDLCRVKSTGDLINIH